jgi:hypothetical protein
MIWTVTHTSQIHIHIFGLDSVPSSFPRSPSDTGSPQNRP